MYHDLKYDKYIINPSISGPFKDKTLKFIGGQLTVKDVFLGQADGFKDLSWYTNSVVTHKTQQMNSTRCAPDSTNNK